MVPSSTSPSERATSAWEHTSLTANTSPSVRTRAIGVSSSVSIPRTPSSGISSSSATLTQCADSLMGSQLLLDLLHDLLAQVLDRDPVDELQEVAPDHQTTGLLLRDPARTQVEEVDLVQAPGRGSVPGTLDLTGEDLQVRHRVHTGVVGELEVAVDLVGVGTGGSLPDDHVTDPHGVGVLAAERALVLHSRAGVGHVVVNE